MNVIPSVRIVALLCGRKTRYHYSVHVRRLNLASLHNKRYSIFGTLWYTVRYSVRQPYYLPPTSIFKIHGRSSGYDPVRISKCQFEIRVFLTEVLELEVEVSRGSRTYQTVLYY